MKSYSVEKANKYIEDKKDSIDSKYKPHYHVTAPVGWINDPNGFSVFNDEYHLFYQYYPYGTSWGPMHWGHVKSTDLILWEHLPVALAPDCDFDKSGCFSGSAIQVGEEHVLMYTGHINLNHDNLDIPEDIRQVQCLAIGDGITYKKIEQNPVIATSQIPKGASINDFRDPKIWVRAGEYFCVVGSRAGDSSGQILLYKSPNLVDWKFVGILDHSKNKVGKMWECPDVFSLDMKDILLISPQDIEPDGYRFRNGFATAYIIGDLNDETGKLTRTSFDEIDYGLDFYAPQTTLAPDGRRIMIAWMQMWNRTIPSVKHGWACAMTLPRELKVINNKLYQFPVKEIETYRKDRVVYKRVSLTGRQQFDGITGRQIELNLEIDMSLADSISIQLMKNNEQYTTISFNKQTSILRFDRSESGSDICGKFALDYRELPVTLQNDILKLRIFIDTYSVELFIQDGEYTMTSTVYSNLSAEAIEFASQGEAVLTIEKWKIEK